MGDDRTFWIGQKQYILTSEGTLCLDMKTFKVESAPAYYNIPEGQVKKMIKEIIGYITVLVICII